MRLVPVGDRVVIRRLESRDVTTGGIFLPDMAQQKPRQGRVLSVGDGRRLADGSRAANLVREGDRVVFSAYAGSEVTIDGEELLLVTEDEILAIVDA